MAGTKQAHNSRKQGGNRVPGVTRKNSFWKRQEGMSSNKGNAAIRTFLLRSKGCVLPGWLQVLPGWL